MTVEIIRYQNASEAFDEDPTDAFSRHFIMRQHVASSRASIGDPTDAT